MVRNWVSEHINIGALRVGVKKEVIFKTLKEDLKIDSMKSSCKCSKPKYDKEKKTLSVTFTPGTIPQHLMHKGAYTTKKSISIRYKNGSEDIISFKATVIR